MDLDESLLYGYYSEDDELEGQDIVVISTNNQA